MNIKLQALLVVATLSASAVANAQISQFFRVTGPAGSQIINFESDGSLVWSNGQAGAAYEIQRSYSLMDGGNWVDYIQLAPDQGILTNLLVAFHPPSGMILIPAGVFTIGNTIAADTDITDADPATVDVSGFYLDANLVTYCQWRSVYSYATNNAYGFDNPGGGKTTNNPVQSINWYDAVKWCNARSQLCGLTPVYYTDAAMTLVYTNGETDSVYANWAANGYRLPTEAEWEKAARGGQTGLRFPWGDTISQTLADYDVNTALVTFSYDLGPNGYNPIGKQNGIPYTVPVGSFAGNDYSLYDMTGNVEEWCWDSYAAQPYPSGSPYLGGSDPRGPAFTGSRVLRGGGWANVASALRCASRGYVAPSSADNYAGFRCARGF